MLSRLGLLSESTVHDDIPVPEWIIISESGLVEFRFRRRSEAESLLSYLQRHPALKRRYFWWLKVVEDNFEFFSGQSTTHFMLGLTRKQFESWLGAGTYIEFCAINKLQNIHYRDNYAIANKLITLSPLIFNLE